METPRERLRALLAASAVGFGDVTLSSGKKSNYYVDCRMVTLSSEGAYLTAKAILELLADDGVEAVGGLTMGADPIAAAVATVSHQEGRPISAFIVRKDPKKHGKSKLVEGPLQEGARVAIVEDVITTGSSILRAINAVEEMGCRVVRVVVLVDRQEGGREMIEEKGYSVTAFFTPADLGIK